MHLNRMLCAALLACSAPGVLAQSATWNFTYTGLYSSAAQQFLPDATITGSFTGGDSDSDGIVEAAELSSFIVASREYAHCAEENGPYSSCTLGRFSYALTGALDFSAGWSGHDEFYTSWYGGVTAGVGSFYHRSGPVDQEDNNFLWTDATTLSISPAPVPEPVGAAMLLAGVALLETARRRARPQQAPHERGLKRRGQVPRLGVAFEHLKKRNVRIADPDARPAADRSRARTRGGAPAPPRMRPALCAGPCRR
jgi:hypothetical protein